MRLSFVGRPCGTCGSDEIDYLLRRGRWERLCSRCVGLRARARPELQRRREIPSGLPIRFHPEPGPEDVAELNCLAGRFRRALLTLTFREREIIRMRWGLDGGVPLTLDECGRAFKVTRERVRQLEAKGLRKLRDPRRAKILAPDLVCCRDEYGSEVYVHEDSVESFTAAVAARRAALDAEHEAYWRRRGYP